MMQAREEWNAVEPTFSYIRVTNPVFGPEQRAKIINWIERTPGAGVIGTRRKPTSSGAKPTG